MADKDIFEDDKDGIVDDIVKDDDKKIITDDKAGVDQLLATIVNEDGKQKYNSVEEALKAAAKAQEHIKTLEKDNSELREKGNASDKLDELLKSIKESKGSGQDGEVSTMKPEDVLNIVKEFFDDTKAAETRNANINMVASEFKNRFGKDASKELYSKAEDLGFSREEINSMIAKNPKAVLKVMGMDTKDKKKTDVVTQHSGYRASDFQGKPQEKPKSIMGGTKGSELVDAFNASRQRTLERLGIKIET